MASSLRLLTRVAPPLDSGSCHRNTAKATSMSMAMTNPCQSGSSRTLLRHALHAKGRSRACWLRPIAASGGAAGDGDRDEARWLREEARWERNEERWAREEQRWLREEKRWEREREQLLLQLQLLKEALAAALNSPVQGSGAIDVEVHLRALGVDHSTSLLSPVGNSSTTVASPPVLPSASSTQVATPIPSTSSVPAPPPTLTTSAPLEPAGPPAAPSVAQPGFSSPSSPSLPSSPPAPASAPFKRRTLRVGSEGDDVQEMQNALMLEGFFCGEEDMEGAYFATATESAVKTWQATMKLPEDGVMTPKLLNMLFGEHSPAPTASQPATPAPSGIPALQQVPTPAPPKSAEPTREKPESERYARSSLQSGEHRVFLLGENRWEDPSRVLRSQQEKAIEAAGSATFQSNGRVNGVVNLEVEAGKGKGMTLIVKQCYECRGEGRVTCMECEGTGDLNVEEQFLDWAGEDAKCLYCSGIGALACDVCDGSGQREG